MTLEEVLTQLENSTNNLFSIESHFRPLSNPDTPDSLELLAEKMAFDFHPDYKHEQLDWNTYYGPQMIWNNHDGTSNIWPHYKLITEQVINYWIKRAFECKNPIMAGRYADLVWDFQYKCTHKHPQIEIAKKCINDYITVANNKLSKNEIDVYKCLERALSIAIKIRATELVNKCKTSIINFERESTQDGFPGTWGYSYNLLIQNKNVNLTKEEENKIIQDLEDILSRVTIEGNEDTWAADNAAKKLAQYYHLTNDIANTKRVLHTLENVFRTKDNNDSAMQTAHWLTEMSDYYKQYQLIDDDDRILIELRSIGGSIDNEMKSIPFEFTITKEQMDNIINPFISGSIDEVLKKFMWGLIPRVSDIKNTLLNEKNHFMSSFNTVIYDSKGRAIGSLGSKEENADRHIIYKTGELMAYESVFISEMLKRIFESHGNISSNIMDFLKNCPIINPQRLHIIKQGVDAHFDSNYVVSLHLLIPQIEDSVRFLVESSRGNILQRNRFGGYDVKTFHEILRHEITLKVLGEDIINYFKALFTHQMGWNLRNSIMHGLAEYNLFDSQKSDRVIHALLCLNVVRKK